ncbi:MAG: hypothetical protein CMF51_03865 [Legionellales bacterium]|nr:hypothetical protein [Legionellales bacterium]
MIEGSQAGEAESPKTWLDPLVLGLMILLGLKCFKRIKVAHSDAVLRAEAFSYSVGVATHPSRARSVPASSGPEDQSPRFESGV